MRPLAILIFLFLRIKEDCSTDVISNVIGWPKLLISNDGKDIRLAEPKITNQSIANNYNAVILHENSTIIDSDSNNRSAIAYHLSTLYEYVDYGSPFDVAVDEGKMFFVRQEFGKNSGGATGDTLVAVYVEKPKKVPRILLKNFFPASDGIAVDWVTKKLYLYDADTHRIEVLDYRSDIDSTKPMMAVLIYDEVFVRSLVVDPMSGYMFWLNDYADSLIERAWMDGTRRRTLIRKIRYPNSLCVDSQAGRLYWTADGGSIWSATLDGSDKRQIITGQWKRPYAVATFENILIWGDVADGGIYYCDKRACAKGENLIRKLKPFTLRIFDQRRQPERSNPCAVNNGNCSHLCLLTPESKRTCTCPIGVKMSSDGITCSKGPERVIITAQRTSIRVFSLDTPDHTEQRIAINRIKHAVAVDYNPFDGYIYWLDTILEAIRRVKLDGSDESDVVVGVNSSAEDLAVDYLAGNVYWTDAGAGRIEVAKIADSSARRILLSSDIKKPRAIVLDPSRGDMYWTDLDELNPRIEKAFLDGSNRLLLVQLEPGRWPNGLALDADAGHIYWTDASWDTLERANSADGSERIVLAEFENSHAWGLTLLGEYIYWTDMQHRSLIRSSKNKDREDRTLITENLIDIMRIKGVDLKNLPTDSNDCAISNGGCTHLCLHRPTGKICMCPLGWELAMDGLNCLVPEGYLVFTQKTKHDIMIASLSRFPTNLDYLRLRNVSQPFSLDYHFKKKYLYWTDMESNDTAIISRAFLNGSNMETVVDYGMMAGESLAIDWLAEQLYWSDSGYNHIEVARLNGQSRKIILWSDIKPLQLAVSPEAGHLYFVNGKATATIERSDLDGRNRMTFLSNVGRVSSMTLDYSTQRLYWTTHDQESGKIRVADLDGKWVPVLLVEEKQMQPYGLTLYGDRLYWADWHKQTIEMCDKNTGKNQTILYANQKVVKSLTAVHALKQKGWNGCSNSEKKCEHLCFAIPHAGHQTHRCDCPTHCALSNDGRSCSPPSNFILFVQKQSIRRLQITDHVSDGPVATLPLKGLRNVAWLKYDQLNRTIYWLEKSNGSSRIRFAHEGGNKVETLILSPNAKIVDFALDPTRQSIFWTSLSSDDSQWPSIGVDRYSNGEWTHLGQVIAQSDAYPKLIAVDPLRGYIFYTDTLGSKASIIRCNHEGKNCKHIFSQEGEISILHLDLDTGALFWYTRQKARIGRVHNDGGELKPDFVANLNHGVSSLTIWRNRLYFVNEKTYQIWSVDKTRGGEKSELVVRQRLTGLSAILAVDEMVTKRLASMDDCPYLKCADICYLESEGPSGTEMKAKCGCAIGKILQIAEGGEGGERGCIDRPKCHPYQWTCNDGLCISRTAVCDGKVDCAQDGGSDEKNCSCPLAHFACHSDDNVKCVPYTQLCGDNSHCDDSSREIICPSILEFLASMEESKQNGRHSNNGSHVIMISDRNNEHIAAYSTLNVAIYVIVAVVFVCFAYGVARWCRRCRSGRKRTGAETATLELRVLHPLTPGAAIGQQTATGTTATTTVEYSATCRVIHHQPSSHSDDYSSVGPLPTPLGSDERPNLTGKSSSSSEIASSSSGHRRGPKNPPPSLVSSAADSRSPDSCLVDNRRNRTSRRHRRHVDDDDRRGSDRYRRSGRHDYRSQQHAPCCSYHPGSPPPPYATCVEESDDSSRMEAQAAVGQRTPLLRGDRQNIDSSIDAEESTVARRDDHRRQPSRRRSQGGGRRSGAGARPPPSSPCSSHRFRYEGPPPTPNDSRSASSCASSAADGAVGGNR